MQIPINLAPTPDAQDARKNPISSLEPGAMLSIESQLKLRALCDYVDSCRSVMDEIRRDLSLQLYEPDSPVDLQRASKRLAKLCGDADIWGFDALYEVALGLQMLLLNCDGRTRQDDFREALRRGLAMLPALLEQCEREFCWKLAISDMLECFDRAAGE